MKFAYADPPYIGEAKRLYACDEIDHRELIQMLDDDFDGWALSLKSTSLKEVLNLCPDDVRVGAWVKPFHVLKAARPSYGWEPVIFKTPHRKKLKDKPLPKDFVSANIKMIKGFNGAKPDEFCFWIFECLGMTPDDDFEDLFYGSGSVTQAYEKWRAEYPEILYRNMKPGPKKRFLARIR